MKQFIALALLVVAVAARPDSVRFVDSPASVADMRPLIVSPEIIQKAAEIARQAYQALKVEVDSVDIVAFSEQDAPVDSVVSEDFSDKLDFDSVAEDSVDEVVNNADIAVDAVRFVDAPVSDDVGAPDAVIFVDSVQEDADVEAREAAAEDAAVEAAEVVNAVEEAEETHVDPVRFVDSQSVFGPNVLRNLDAPEAQEEQVLVMPELQLFQRYPVKHFDNPALRGARQ